MKRLSRFFLLASILGCSSASAQVILQDFSNTLATGPYFYGTWEATGDTFGTTNPNPAFFQGIAGVYNIVGASAVNGAASKVEFFYGPELNIGTNTSLSVSAETLADNVASSFRVTLIDTGNQTAFATFLTMDFVTGSTTTIAAPLTFVGLFDPTIVEFMIISGNQPGGTDRFNVSFDNISAVSAIPEPGTYAALAGVFVLGFAVWRRSAVAA